VKTPIRFNRHTNKLFIDWDWQTKVDTGEFIIVEGFVIIDPDAYNKVYNDRLLKKLATAYIKKQWGNNMKKFQGMQLPGGITMNGQQIYNEAVDEINNLEQLIRDTHSEPPNFIIG